MIERKEPFRAHAFDVACARNDIDHRLTKPKHPWTSGQVERMNRTINDATVKRFHYDTHDELRSHLADFVSAYNFAKRLKNLKGLTPYEYICRAWTKEPERFTLNPANAGTKHLEGLTANVRFSSHELRGLTEGSVIPHPSPRYPPRGLNVCHCCRVIFFPFVLKS
jgi:Integrase core domain